MKRWAVVCAMPSVVAMVRLSCSTRSSSALQSISGLSAGVIAVVFQAGLAATIHSFGGGATCKFEIETSVVSMPY
jgi:hypothetical protein